MPANGYEIMEGIFMPNTKSRAEKMQAHNQDFVHYTSADAALKIIRSQTLWMRSTSVMNDFAEIKHGERCLSDIINKNGVGERIDEIYKAISPEKAPEWRQVHEDDRYYRIRGTYIACLSEHKPGSNADMGKLSMWRAYGGSTNVALIFDRDVILNAPRYPFKLSAVIYGDDRTLLTELKSVIRLMDEYKKVLADNPELFDDYLWGALHNLAISLKHPGFIEEKEWRFSHCPDLFGSHDELASTIESLNGVPQKVYELPLKKLCPDDKDVLDTILKKVIIGPTPFPDAISDAIISELETQGYTSAEINVVTSDIPWRR